MKFLKLSEQNVAGKTVLIRADLNVPIKDGRISDDTRIRASLPSIRYCLDRGAAVIVMTHLGRPTEGEFHPEDDVTPVARQLGALLGKQVAVLKDWRDSPPKLHAGEIAMLQNVRINPGEKKNDPTLGKAYAALADVFVNDAFGTAHRAQASTEAVAAAAPLALAGIPLVAIVAGSKVSTKLTVLENLADKVDQLIVGGGIANTFLLAQGKNIGKSLAEPDLVDEAKKIIAKMAAKGGAVPLPTDVVCAKEFAADAAAETKSIDDVADDDMILDIGPQSAAVLADLVKKAGTVVWNGPVGVFEFEQFAGGTEVLAKAIADSSAFSIAGGGDTLAAVAKFGIGEQVGYISTGGGAFLEFLEGKELPAVAALARFAD